MTANVTQAMIDNAMRADNAHCPIATAIAHEFPEARHIKVTRDEIRYTNIKTGIRKAWRTPRNAQKFIDAYDLGENPHPVRVNLEGAELLESRAMKARKPAAVMHKVTAPKTVRGTRTARPTHAANNR